MQIASTAICDGEPRQPPAVHEATKALLAAGCVFALDSARQRMWVTRAVVCFGKFIGRSYCQQWRTKKSLKDQACQSQHLPGMLCYSRINEQVGAS